MRTAILFLAATTAFALSVVSAGAQVHVDTNSVGTARLAEGSFAVPEAPALKMLELDDSKLLRPASVKGLTAQLSSATGNGSFIPSAFALEFSPGLLLKGEKLSLTDYRAAKYWYRIRASVASKRNDGANARTQLALGLRLSLQDNSDLRTDSSYVQAILGLTDWKRDSMLIARLAQIARGVPVTERPTEQQQAAIDEEVARQLSGRAARVGALVDSVKRAEEDVQWNESAFDVAVGMVASSVDSTASDPRFDGVAAWATKGWRLGSRAQLLLGARGAVERDLKDTVDTSRRRSLDAILRLYVGSNAYKLLVDGQVTGRESSAPKWLANGGAELQISSILWITGSVGWEKVGGASDSGRLVSSFKFKLNPPR